MGAFWAVVYVFEGCRNIFACHDANRNGWQTV